MSDNEWLLYYFLYGVEDGIGYPHVKFRTGHQHRQECEVSDQPEIFILREPSELKGQRPITLKYFFKKIKVNQKFNR